ncbi:carbohydrate esterase, partial [Rhypophila decipiens]
TLDKRQDPRCGPGLPACGDSRCCSKAGFCGYTNRHCGAHCQVGRGRCDIDALRRLNRPWPRLGGIWHTTCVEPNTVALTWDDGPSDYTWPLLDLLKWEGAKGTFFVNGQNRERQPFDTRDGTWSDFLKRIVRDGHQLASHTWSHAASLEDLAENSPASLDEEVMWTESMFDYMLGGVFPTYMRPPYGACKSDKCLKRIAELGYTVAGWNLDTRDFANQNQIGRSKDIFSSVLFNDNDNQRKTIALAHDVWPKTLDLARHMISESKRRGVRFVTVAECLGDWDPTNWYRDSKTGRGR